jgi:hypothetical protein
MGVVDQAGLSEEALMVVWPQSRELTIKDSKGPVSGRADTDTLESRREGPEWGGG